MARAFGSRVRCTIIESNKILKIVEEQFSRIRYLRQHHVILSYLSKCGSKKNRRGSTFRIVYSIRLQETAGFWNPSADQESTKSPASAAKCILVRLVGIFPPDSKSTEPTADRETTTSQQLSSTHTPQTTRSTGTRHNSSQTSTTGFPTDFERLLKSTSMTLYHRTLVSTSAIFGAPSSHLSPMGPLYPRTTLV